MLARLAAIPNLQCLENVPLSRYTRFAIGGPARLLADASTEPALTTALRELGEAGCPHTLIGGGSNLVADDAGFPGVILRYTESGIEIDPPVVRVRAGAVLQNLVDATIEAGLRGIETMTGIPGWVG
ncbi:MAG: FAD-binding protein, partial [Bryobacteraceae bacterium]